MLQRRCSGKATRPGSPAERGRRDGGGTARPLTSRRRPLAPRGAAGRSQGSGPGPARPLPRPAGPRPPERPPASGPAPRPRGTGTAPGCACDSGGGRGGPRARGRTHEGRPVSRKLTPTPARHSRHVPAAGAAALRSAARVNPRRVPPARPGLPRSGPAPPGASIPAGGAAGPAIGRGPGRGAGRPPRVAAVVSGRRPGHLLWPVRPGSGTATPPVKIPQRAGRVAQWLERGPAHRRVSGWIPGQGHLLGCKFDSPPGGAGAGGNQSVGVTCVSPSRALSFPPSHSIYNQWENTLW